MSSVAFAGTPRQKAIAAVDVAKAQIQIFMQRAQLKDSQSHFLQAEPEVVQPRVEPEQFQGPIQDLEPEALVLNDTPVDAALSESPTPPTHDESTTSVGGVLQPMRLEIVRAEAIQQSAYDPHIVKFYTGEKKYNKGWCTHCPEYRAIYGEGDNRIRMEYSDEVPPDGIEHYPALRFTGADGKLRFPADKRGHYWIPETLDQLADIVERNGPEKPAHAIASSGFGGVLHARGHIAQAQAWWIQNVGSTKADGSPVKVSFAWRRTGGQMFPLLHQQPKQWSCKNIMGTLGEFEFDAPGSKLPITPILIGYRCIGSQFSLRGEISIPQAQLGFPGDAVPNATYGAQPAGFSPMTILTIVQVIQGISSLLNPTVDLTLGGQVSADIWFDDKKQCFVVEFHDLPGIKIVAWWQFDLKVKSLTVSTTNVHIEVDGSRIIKSRDIAVQE